MKSSWTNIENAQANRRGGMGAGDEDRRSSDPDSATQSSGAAGDPASSPASSSSLNELHVRRLHHYYPTALSDDWAEPVWPAEIVNRFSTSRPSFFAPTYLFAAGSEDERSFLELVEQFGVDVFREVFVDVRPQQIESFSHYRLTVETVDVKVRDFIDFSGRCRGAPKGHCLRGIEQVARPFFSFRSSRGLDIFELAEPRRPRVMIVSRRLRDLMIDEEITGCEFVACVDSDDPDPPDISFAPNPSLDESARFFQVVVTRRVRRHGKHGFLRRGASCAACGEAMVYLGGATALYAPTDLSSADFQLETAMVGPNGDVIAPASPGIIVTSRFVKLITENEMKGWTCASTDPSIRFEVVHVGSYP